MSIDHYRAFVAAADHGSFSAAARHLGKAQSAISTAIATLEIDMGVTLFDRSTKIPLLTERGQALLPHARGILLGEQELMAKAQSMAEGIEDRLCIALEQGISMIPLHQVLHVFALHYPHVSLELLEPGPNDTAILLKEGRADLGLMIEQEDYPLGFQFRGIGHSRLIPVCRADHPLAGIARVTHRDLRAHRQLIPRSRSLSEVRHLGERKSADVWFADSPYLILDLLLEGFGWAELPAPVVADQIAAGALTELHYAFQQSDILEGIDVVWTEQRALGTAGQWLRDQILDLPQEVWR
jgi:DNA-binding transcriptional LysR family regulator